MDGLFRYAVGLGFSVGERPGRHNLWVVGFPVVRIADIQRVVAAEFGVTVSDFKSERRVRQVARPRQVAMQLCHDLTDMSYPVIGRAFGHRDHTTVMYAVRRVAELRRTKTGFNRTYERVRIAVLAELS